jgi:hypothetical protein
MVLVDPLFAPGDLSEARGARCPMRNTLLACRRRSIGMKCNAERHKSPSHTPTPVIRGFNSVVHRPPRSCQSPDHAGVDYFWRADPDSR